MWNLIFKNTKWTYLQNRNRLTDLRTNLGLPKGIPREEGNSGAWTEQTHTTICKIDNQQGHTV